MCRSKKKEVQVVGWCSLTLAIMGMWIFAYLHVTRKMIIGYVHVAMVVTRLSYMCYNLVTTLSMDL